MNKTGWKKKKAECILKLKELPTDCAERRILNAKIHFYSKQIRGK
jgi:hypothetical protein